MVTLNTALGPLITQAQKELTTLGLRQTAARAELANIARQAEELRREITRALGEEAPHDTDDQVARRMCLQMGYEFDILRRHTRTLKAVRQRAAVWSALKALGWSHARIGAAFGFNHTTVHYALSNHLV